MVLQSSDKLVVEIFPESEQQTGRVRSILEHLISPGQEVGGDSRLLIPSNKNVITADEVINGQVRHRQLRILYCLNKTRQQPLYILQLPLLEELCKSFGISTSDNTLSASDLHVYEVSVRDNYQKWVSDQEKELCSRGLPERHGILLCSKVRGQSATIMPDWAAASAEF